jgi:DNA helicase-2/ATP-dependent DNA helicase PcrA
MTLERSVDEDLERDRLARVVAELRRARDQLAERLRSSASAIDDMKAYIWDNQREMDRAEKVSMRSEVDVSVTVADHAVTTLQRVDRLIPSPYFGRVDFHADGDAGTDQHYIGRHGFADPNTLEPLVHDWRAPVSSIYYDFEAGDAHFETPTGEVRGRIWAKRQYRIDDERLVYMVESSLNIGDEVLQLELSRSTDAGMRDIVTTIQREQNAIIRDERATVLILQGVAGSGKTSIAMHRVAYLLYRHKETLRSSDIMVLSPNKVFGDYISTVLPELGEDPVVELDADAIAKRYLQKLTRHETFAEQVTALLEGVDDEAAERMRWKATPEFVTELETWVGERSEDALVPAPIEIRRERLDAEWVDETYAALPTLPLFTRVERVAEAAIHRLKLALADRGWTAKDAATVRKQVAAMCRYRNPLELYRAFYEAPERRGYFVQLRRGTVEFADAFPIVLTLLRTTSERSPFSGIKHLLVDEMQDYTPAQYAVLRALFSCPMTILGDASQSLNPYSSSSLEVIQSGFPEAEGRELRKSYRSTIEITRFTQRIRPNPALIPVERHGSEPEVIACSDAATEVAEVGARIERFERGGHRTLGVICKTARQAATLHQALASSGIATTLLDDASTSFSAGAIVTTAHLAKGLEFDVVVVPSVNDDDYRTEMDRGMLYIACTRALHELSLTHQGAASRLIRTGEAPLQ